MTLQEQRISSTSTSITIQIEYTQTRTPINDLTITVEEQTEVLFLY